MNKTAVSGIILAGGESRRLGQDKAFLTLGSKTLTEIIRDKLKSVLGEAELIISANQLEKYKNFKRLSPAVAGTDSSPLRRGEKIVPDVFPERSSLNGIYSSLRAAENFYGFVIACDLPLVNPEFIKYLINQREEYDVVIPESLTGLEPLCAVYSKNCLSLMERQLKNKNFKIIEFFPEIKLKVINLKKIDWLKSPEEAGIFNINTIEDYTCLLKQKKIAGSP
ncbi:MAG: molybdenum cofactor guanylyltransferase [Planctomycetota bacterium]